VVKWLLAVDLFVVRLSMPVVSSLLGFCQLPLGQVSVSQIKFINHALRRNAEWTSGSNYLGLLVLAERSNDPPHTVGPP